MSRWRIRCNINWAEGSCNRNERKHNGRISDTIPQNETSYETLFTALREDGFVKIPNFGLSDSDLVELQSEYWYRMRLDGKSTATSAGTILKNVRKLNKASAIINKLLYDKTGPQVWRLVKRYLGGRNMSAVYNGYASLHLSNRLTRPEHYVSSTWHHDTCGRRLKMFLFLNDVSESGGRPTVVARRSASNFYFTTGVPKSRFNETWV